MGRAIDMEKDIDTLKRQMSELKTTLSEILDATSTKKNVDLVEETKKETKVETKKKKTNNDSSGKRSGKSSD